MIFCDNGRYGRGLGHFTLIKLTKPTPRPTCIFSHPWRMGCNKGHHIEYYLIRDMYIYIICITQNTIFGSGNWRFNSQDVSCTTSASGRFQLVALRWGRPHRPVALSPGSLAGFECASAASGQRPAGESRLPATGQKKLGGVQVRGLPGFWLGQVVKNLELGHIRHIHYFILAFLRGQPDPNRGGLTVGISDVVFPEDAWSEWVKGIVGSS